jgi:phage tail sheath protein FI
MAAADFPNRRTPGVYFTEIPSFPASVVGVATAVPVFVGYTERAAVDGKPCFNKPMPIRSLAEFERVFGCGYKAVYNLEEVSGPASDDDYDFEVFDTSTSPPTSRYYELTPAYASATSSPPASPPEGAGSGAAPALPRFNLYTSMRLFYDNRGADCYVVSVGTYDQATAGVEAARLLEGLDASAEQVGPTMIVVPDAVLIAPDDAGTPWISSGFNRVATRMLKIASTLQDRIAILDVYGSQYANASDGTRLDEVIREFRAALPTDGLSYGAAYFPFLQTSVIPLSDVDYLSIDSANPTLQTILEWENTSLYAGTPRYDAVQHDIGNMYADTSPGAVTRLNQELLAALPVLKTIEQQVIARNDVLPPSGAIAGVYARVDASSGVWNAPANVTLAGVVRPSLALDSKEQEDLNLPVDGKAVDALRAFPGRGTVVWGARTLDGTSPDYRYVQVRRTLIYIEQSIKAALDPFVFAPNTGQTWATVVAMVSGFLQGLWSRGALMGATPAEAFTVQCGVGSTMTATDVLDGYMIVQVTLSLIRPAEFIELTFKQTMQGMG